jgi:hypothetical protein
MRVISLALALLLTAGAAQATQNQSGSAAPEASIPFVPQGGIRSWRADGSQGLWVQGSHRKWYYAKFLGRCPGLNFAHTIAFDTTPMGTFDRFSAVIVPDWGRCQVRSLTPSDGPPRKQDADKSEADKPEKAGEAEEQR